MTDQIRAAHLPDGSVVSSAHTTYLKDHPSETDAWRGTGGGHHGDWEVDKALAGGAEVLRVGDRSIQVVAGARWGNLTVPERAALDAWTRGSADTNGMLYAVRHALAVERNAVGPPLAPDARERLARHLYLTASGNADAQPHWDHGVDQPVDRGPWLAEADTILAVVRGDKA
ncbi:hypothetical protein ACFP2T_36815 [Plantactinospora solaniradicis]|uniref:Uncharacterized protein n=1 Tax=Plantactinospora solaniradicis TaxID=1723736 RepID=A0ABW1KIY8_9ACTN